MNEGDIHLSDISIPSNTSGMQVKKRNPVMAEKQTFNSLSHFSSWAQWLNNVSKKNYL